MKISKNSVKSVPELVQLYSNLNFAFLASLVIKKGKMQNWKS